MNKYFLTDGKNKFGPFSKEELSNQNISKNTKVWYYDLENWTEISKVSDLKDVLNSIPPDLNSKHAFRSEQSDTFETKSNSQKDTKSIPQNINKKGVSNTVKWLITIVIISLISVISYSVTQRQSNIDQYNLIVANSYESDENFDIYVEKFYRDLEFYGIFPKKPKEKIIKFSKLDQLDNKTHIHGVSFGLADDDRIEIYINPSSWRQFNKPMRYILMYHELAHDVLNLDDLNELSLNEGKLMYPSISSYENKNMDDFIESFHATFEEQ